MSLDVDSKYIPKGIWEWYPHSITREDPPTQPVITADGKKVQHGTFNTYPYYAVIKAGKPENEKLLLVSDCGLRAELDPIENTPHLIDTPNRDYLGVYSASFSISFDDSYWSALLGAEPWKKLKDKFNIPTLTLNPELCDYEDALIVVTGTPSEFVYLPSGSHDTGKHYVPTRPRVPISYDEANKLGSVFVHKIYAFNLFLRAWDVRYMDLVDQNFQVTGNQSKLFAEPSGDSLKYVQVGGNINVPYGWVYESHAGGEMHEASSVVATSADVANSVQQAAGFNIAGGGGFQAGFVSVAADFSYARNKGLKTKIGEVRSEEKTFLEKTILQTEAAFVLDKRNVTLSDHFKARVNELRRQILQDGRLADEVLASLFEQFGTHYAYAGITGARGRLVTTTSSSALKQLEEKGENAMEKWEAGAEVHIMGPMFGAKARAGGEKSGETDEEKQTETILKDNDTYIVTYGGTSSDGGQLGAGNRVPVLLDLRPISDLFTIPFFGDEAAAILLHDEIAKAVSRFALTREQNVQPTGQPTPATTYRRITFGKFKIEVAEPDPSKSYTMVFDQATEKFVPKGFYVDASRLKSPSSWRAYLSFPREMAVVSTETKAFPDVSKLGVHEMLPGFKRVAIWPEGGTSVVLAPSNKPEPVKVAVEVKLKGEKETAVSTAVWGQRQGATPGINFDNEHRTFLPLDLTKPGAVTLGPIVLYNLAPEATSRALPFPIEITCEVKIEEVS